MRLYGWMGLLLAVLAEVNFFFKIQPFAEWYFPIIWTGYILFIDALVFKLKKISPISSEKRKLIALLILSIPFWYVFEFFNAFIQNWHYNTSFGTTARIISAMFITPAIYETYEFVKATRIFSKLKNKKIKSSCWQSKLMMTLSIPAFLLPIYFPKYAFPLVWFAFFMILDPLNMVMNAPSMLKNFLYGKKEKIASLALGGIIVGFFWEFWNYWAIPKWFYTIPFFDFLKIFEMPLLGYLGYVPFAFSVYAMWNFVFAIKKKIMD